MITIQKVVSNVQSVARQSPDIYWHTKMYARRPCSVQHSPHSEYHCYWNCLKYFCVFCTVIIRCTDTFCSHCICEWRNTLLSKLICVRNARDVKLTELKHLQPRWFRSLRYKETSWQRNKERKEEKVSKMLRYILIKYEGKHSGKNGQ
jgi:hypothetical protein